MTNPNFVQHAHSLDTPAVSPRALVFVGHGTRSDEGTRMFMDTVRRAIQRLPEAVHQDLAAIHVAYLELRTPDIATVLTDLYRRGIRDAYLVPVLLFAAGHWKHDIPAQVATAMVQCPELRVTLGPVLGGDPRLIALAARRCREAAGPLRDGDALVVVGRGNRDEEAMAAFEHVAAGIRRLLLPPHFTSGMLAGFGPSLEEAMQRVMEQGTVRRLVLLPYLLFEGYLTRTLPERTQAALRALGTLPEVVIAPTLGPDDTVAEVLAERVRETLAITV